MQFGRPSVVFVEVLIVIPVRLSSDWFQVQYQFSTLFWRAFFYNMQIIAVCIGCLFVLCNIFLCNPFEGTLMLNLFLIKQKLFSWNFAP